MISYRPTTTSADGRKTAWLNAPPALIQMKIGIMYSAVLNPPDAPGARLSSSPSERNVTNSTLDPISRIS
jgi:hypothetical protein